MTAALNKLTQILVPAFNNDSVTQKVTIPKQDFKKYYSANQGCLGNTLCKIGVCDTHSV